jgi:hypothetical protein
MQRTIYNVWGRQLRTPEEANARAEKALKENPKITNLHIARIEPTYDLRFRYFYQARWCERAYERERKAWASGSPHVCNCPYCEIRD